MWHNSLLHFFDKVDEMISGQGRPQPGCWTCRLRRKGCDGAMPECENCKGLGITCHRSLTKPEWMDGGGQEKAMAEAIKHQIKDKAIGRRERQIQGQASIGSSTPFIVASQDNFMSGNESTTTESHTVGGSTIEESSSANERIKIATSILNTASISSSGTSSGSIETPKTSAEAWELDFIMIYLDHVFPFLFPFYQPPLVGTSRAWLLSFVKQNDSIFHSVISLSSFFFTIGHKDIFQDRLQLCRWTLWEQVSKQAKMAFESIQSDIEQLKSTESSLSLVQKIQMMETILQLLIFEQFVGGSDGWQKHLEAALDLFESILVETSSADAAEPVLDRILNLMHLPGPQVVGFEKVLWNSHQSAFRFFTALLIQYDIIASTVLRKPPRLHQYHSELLGELPVHEIGTPLNLGHFFGCRNGVLRTIADISALASWKFESRMQNMTLSHLELLERGMPLFERLKSLENQDQETRDTNGEETWHLKPYYRSPSQLTSTGLEGTVNRIWIHAARIYLSIVLFGWKSNDTQVMADVTQATELLKLVDSPAQLRTLSWPICAIGCMADGVAEGVVIDSIIERAQSSQLMSSLREAGRIIMNVTGDDRDFDFSYLGSEKDIAMCFQKLGKPVLLV